MRKQAGLSSIYQSLTEGGHFLAVVWASSEKVPLICVVMNTIMKETNTPLPPPGLLDRVAFRMKIALRILL